MAGASPSEGQVLKRLSRRGRDGDAVSSGDA
jgi:hypothetical protein